MPSSPFLSHYNYSLHSSQKFYVSIHQLSSTVQYSLKRFLLNALNNNATTMLRRIRSREIYAWNFRRETAIIRLKYNNKTRIPSRQNSMRRTRGRRRIKFAQEKYATRNMFEFDVTRERAYTRDRRVHTACITSPMKARPHTNQPGRHLFPNRWTPGKRRGNSPSRE